MIETSNICELMHDQNRVKEKAMDSAIKGHTSKSKPAVFMQEVTEEGLGKEYPVFGNKALIGRNMNAEIPVNSSSVSRNHALLEFSGKRGWSVTDNRSINGVYVDQHKTKPAVPYPLKGGEIISLGPPELAKFKFKFLEGTGSKKKKNKLPSTDPRPGQPENSIPGSSRLAESPSSRLTRQNSVKRSASQESIISPKKLFQSRSEGETSLKDQLQSVKSVLMKNEEINKRIKEILNKSEEKLSAALLHLSTRFKVHTQTRSVDACNEYNRHPREFRYNADCNSQESASLLSQNKSYNDEVFDAYDNPSTQEYKSASQDSNQNLTKKDLECNNIDNAAFFELTQPSTSVAEVDDLRAKIDALQKELQERERAKAELENKLKEKDTLIEKEIIQKQQQEQEKLKLENTKIIQQTVNKEIANQFEQLMETEFTCSICTELFIKATTLQCAHTFCTHCLETWRKTKKECPICRAHIVTATPSLVIDGFIDKMVERLSPQDQEKRKAIVNERLKEAEKKKKPASSRSTRRSAGRSARGSRSRRNPQPTVEVEPISWPQLMEHHPLLEMFIQESPSFVDLINLTDEDDEEDDPVDGYGYYPGYGRCYNCGRPGHWANGCPDRM